MENVISEALSGDAQRNALALASFFRENDVMCERSSVGYWADKIYFVCNYKNQSVCYISINEHENNTWYVTGDDSDSDWYANYPLDDNHKEVAWENIDVCGDCGGCGDVNVASRKTIFGKEFDRVCLVTIKFTNPDADTIECMKAVFGARIKYIQQNEAV